MISMEEFNRIMQWVAKNIDSNKIHLEDKLYIMSQLAACMENIKPIYDKYTTISIENLTIYLKGDHVE